MPCRLNRQRLWAARIVLEAGAHAESSFVTLTYQRFDVPWQLEPDDLRDFLKRLRSRSGKKFRYYAAAEYGSRSLRPHFHLALFGFSMMWRDQIARCWPFGFVHAGMLTAQSATYIAKYVTKKWIGDDLDPRIGKRAEFSRMSLNPGIGALAMEATVAGLVERGGAHALVEAGDVPGQVRIEGRRAPLGRYLRLRLREGVGWDPGAPPDAQRAVQLEVQAEGVKAREVKRANSAAKAAALFEIAESKRRLS